MNTELAQKGFKLKGEDKMKTVSLSGKKVKFAELNIGAVFVDGSYDNSVYIKTYSTNVTNKSYGLCIYSSACDNAIEGEWYEFFDDHLIIEVDVNIEIIPKRG